MISQATYLEVKNELIPTLGLPLRTWVEQANELGDHASLDALVDIDIEMTNELQEKIHRIYEKLHPEVQKAVKKWDSTLGRPRLELVVNKT
jgi:hypothetical protein